jgi:GT2 family glycosyltransferase
MIDLSIIILSYNTKKYTLDCLESIYRNKTIRKYDIWVVDNASSDGTGEEIKERFPEVHIINNKSNIGFAAGNNVAIKNISKTSNYCLLLNSDTVVEADFITSILGVVEEKNYSILSCRLVGKDNKLQPNAGSLPKPLAIFTWLSGVDDLIRGVIGISSYQERGGDFYKGTRRVGWVSGSVMLIDNRVVDSIGLLDDKIFMYAEDVDYCWRAEKKGLNIGWTDKCTVTHLGGGSSKEPKYHQWLGEFRGLIYLYKKHYGKAQAEMLRFFIRLFILLRIISFYIISRKEVANTYGKVFKEI